MPTFADKINMLSFDEEIQRKIIAWKTRAQYEI
jgi:hypothetical protein